MMLAKIQKYQSTFCLICLIAFISTGCTFGKKSKDSSSKSNENLNLEPIEVFVEPLEKTEIYDPRIYSARVDVEDNRPLYSAISGFISKIYVEAGASVERNQPIISVQQPSAVGYEPHIVRAPMSGYVTRVNVSLGERIEPNIELAKVAKLEGFQTTIHVTYEEQLKINKDDLVDILIAENNDQSFVVKGVVKSVASQASQDSGTYEVKINLENKDEEVKKLLTVGSFIKVAFKENLRSGFKLRQKILSGERDKILLISKVFKAKWVQVKTGASFGDYVEITTGLDDYLDQGYKIVTSYSRYPKDDDLLVIKTEEDTLNILLDGVAKPSSDSSKEKG